jgi:hypothetical protein
MTTSPTIPRTDAGRRELLQHLSFQLPNYADILEISAADIDQVQRGSDWFDYSLKVEDAAQRFTDGNYAFKRVLRDGPKSAVINFPAPLVIIPPPTSEPYPDIIGFLGALIVRIKKHKNYTEAIGKALHIIPPQTPATDPALLQPELTFDYSAGHPVLYWYHNGTDALVIEADYGTGTFGLVAIQLSTRFEDNTPLQLPGNVALWKYRAIYRIRDNQVGQWSKVLEVSVKG